MREGSLAILRSNAHHIAASMLTRLEHFQDWRAIPPLPLWMYALNIYVDEEETRE
jgi:hypothetical protein